MDTVGWAHYRQGSLIEAEQAFRAARDLLPGDASIQYHLGLMAYKQGRRAEALSAFKRALLLDPDFPDAAATRRLIEELGEERSATRG